MNDLEQRLTTALADQVTAVRAPADLAGRCLARGRQARRRRQWSTGVSAAVLAIAVAVPSVRMAGGGDESPGPEATSVPSVTSSASPSTWPDEGADNAADPAKVLGWLRGLPVGPAEEADVGGTATTVTYGGKVYRRPRGGEMIPEGTTIAGLLVVWHDEGFTGGDLPNARTILLRPDGTYRLLATGQFGGADVAADGARIVYGIATKPGAGQLIALDLRTNRKDVLSGGYTAEWTRDGVLIAGLDGSGGTGPAALWQPGQQPRRLGDFEAEAAGPGSDRIVRTTAKERCRMVVSTSAPDRPLYEGCDDRQPLDLSPDGRHVVLASHARVRNLDTGVETDFRVDGVSSGWSIEWADSEHLLMSFEPELIGGDVLATARCDLSGSCESAGPPPAGRKSR